MSRNNPPIISFYTWFLKLRIKSCKRKAEKHSLKSEKYAKKAEFYEKKLAEEESRIKNK